MFSSELNEGSNPQRPAHIQKCSISGTSYLQRDKVLHLPCKKTHFLPSVGKVTNRGNKVVFFFPFHF